MPTREQLAKIRTSALDLIQARDKVKNLRFAQALVDDDASGKKVFQIAATDESQKVFEIAVDENGAELNLKNLNERAGRALFGGDRRPIGWYRERYSYSVKVICGTQEVADGCCCLPAVRPGVYATEVNIHNFHPYRSTWVSKSLLPMVLSGVPVGREPRSVGRQAFDEILLSPDSATMDDCCRIRELLYESAPPAGSPLTVAFLEIVSDIPLNVTAVYTVTDHESRSVAIDVEEVSVRSKPVYYWWPWVIENPIPVVNPNVITK